MNTTSTNSTNNNNKAHEKGNGYLIDTKAAAKHMAVSVSMVKSLTAKKKLKSYKIGRVVRYRLSDINSYVAGCVN